MPILEEELPSSLKTLKHVDIACAGSSCPVSAVLILVQKWFFPKVTEINVEGIQISVKQAERPSLVRFQDPFPILLGLPKLGDEGSLEAQIYGNFSHFPDYLAVLQSHRLLYVIVNLLHK